jgi:hypothetical protein
MNIRITIVAKAEGFATAYPWLKPGAIMDNKYDSFN